MSDCRQIKKPKKKSVKNKALDEQPKEKLSKAKQQKLRELDCYLDEVLESAGEDFLDQFKQIEGE